MGCKCEGGQFCPYCDDSLFTQEFTLEYNEDAEQYEIQRGESK
jgi:hypothetical protein